MTEMIYKMLCSDISSIPVIQFIEWTWNRNVENGCKPRNELKWKMHVQIWNPFVGFTRSRTNQWIAVTRCLIFYFPVKGNIFLLLFCLFFFFLTHPWIERNNASLTFIASSILCPRYFIIKTSRLLVIFF